ncbi:LysR family transcriptional regulator [Phenylobacterium montanum]|uniref:LysR family transcriptional regulator n=1 Tax=Phenylobacterium montanum TaxID=2823693 RepID=A0A975FWD0_9CAUL|nr:LysR family transcriptional regulator [Caulobacter sp. S6]QUD86615.1 LysR family transcriptional regulator [Caulobacter sp. S6]
MPEIHFAALDLNLLRVFHALAEEGSVTRAGARLGLSQSAVSHALNRLRYALDDELFVRGPAGMRPTARALEIAPRLHEGLRHLQLAVAPAEFVPAETRRRFTIAAGAYTSTVLMPTVIAMIRQAAPLAEVRLQLAAATLGEDLMTGRVDLAIGAFGRSTPSYEREALFSEAMVWAVRADHPAARAGVLTLADIAATPHVLMSSSEEDVAVDGRVTETGLERRVFWDDRGEVDEVLARAGLRRTVALRVQDAHSALAIVSRCDMIAITPRRLSTTLAAHYDLRLFEAPYASPLIQIEALWRREVGETAPIAWLRGCLRAAAAQL